LSSLATTTPVEGIAAWVYGEAFRAGLKPEPLLTVSQWADRYRVLSQRASAEPGPWRTDRTPYLREIMDCLSPSSPIERTILMKGAQIGGTECGNNWIGFVIHQAPGPMMGVQPTVEMAKRNSKQRIDPLIEESKALKELVRDHRSRDSGNTILAKEFPSGVLVLTGANSAAGLRSMAARYLFLDEVDGYPGDIDGEGDPVNLALARTRTFARRKLFMVSTPKITGLSRIERAYEESDQRKYWVPCPHCAEHQVLKFQRLQWPKGEPDKAVYLCEHCDQAIENYRKTWMLERGQWRASTTGDGRTAGFHLSSLYSPVGWFSWSNAARMFLEAQKSPALLQVFINTVLGETWVESGEVPDWHRLYERRELYQLGTVPSGGLILTAGADVQKDRVELQVVAWGEGKESWLVDYAVLDGDVGGVEVWGKLTAALGVVYRHAGGADLGIDCLAIDSGYATQEVYAWARHQAPGRVIVIKGVEHAVAAIGRPAPVEVTHAGKKLARGVRVWPISTSTLKSELYGWLRLAAPVEGQPFPPGYCHFPQLGDEFFQQLTAEQLVARTIRGGYRKHEWQKIRARNEALDNRVYARAASIVKGVDRFTPERWAQMREHLGGVVALRPEQPAQPQERPWLTPRPDGWLRRG